MITFPVIWKQVALAFCFVFCLFDSKRESIDVI